MTDRDFEQRMEKYKRGCKHKEYTEWYNKMFPQEKQVFYYKSNDRTNHSPLSCLHIQGIECL
jgi:hypothetical protein